VKLRLLLLWKMWFLDDMKRQQIEENRKLLRPIIGVACVQSHTPKGSRDSGTLDSFLWESGTARRLSSEQLFFVANKIFPCADIEMILQTICQMRLTVVIS
jgi:hypothetical protein